ncbi:hypothetical protein GLOIN_2v1782827 [Rhizophagus clarus]|uniref:Uncharacterized protein n=1 Tax=Rhizophagus clarus TaxID=94130 RepID=A0A8H3R5I0_9GLOM|nr:hypothetical protein GLOIN_2v1782827 [Rhizophagus clarus]
MSSLPIFERATPLFPRGGISPFCTWSVVHYPILPCESDYLPITNTVNKKRICCGNSELSVLVSGAIENIDGTELELWLQEITSLSFEHIIKKQENGPNHCEISFSAVMHFKSKKLETESSDKIRPPSDLSDTECFSLQPKTDDIPYQIV